MKHPSQFKVADSKPNQDNIPDWFLHCKNVGHMVDSYIDNENQTINFECADCNKIESIK